MKRCIVTYAAGAHEELLDVAWPLYKAFADRHGYELVRGIRMTDLPPAWNKVPLMLRALADYDEVVWFDCDMVIVDGSKDFPPLNKLHAMVRHFELYSEVPNSGVWRLRNNERMHLLLSKMLELTVFTNHGWWEQAALLTLMGYCVPPESAHDYADNVCRRVVPTEWYECCEFMRLEWNSHPNYRAEHPRIVHCSYPDMARRLEVMRELVKDPTYKFPKFKEKDE